jgi:hypothetical protein
MNVCWIFYFKENQTMNTNTLNRTQIYEQQTKNETIAYEKTHRPKGYISEPGTLEYARDLIEDYRLNRLYSREPIPAHITEVIADLVINRVCTAYKIQKHLRVFPKLLKRWVADRKSQLAEEAEQKAQMKQAAYHMGTVDTDWNVSCSKSDGTKLILSGNGQIPDLTSTIQAFLAQAA